LFLLELFCLSEFYISAMNLRKDSIPTATIPKTLLIIYAFWMIITNSANAQGHDAYICTTLDVTLGVGANQAVANGLYKRDGSGVWQHFGIDDPYLWAVSFDPRDDNVFYTATLNGVLRTIDGGQHWRIMTSWDIAQPKDLRVDPNAPDTIYVALPDGVVVSPDQGTTWIRKENGLPDRGKYAQTIEVDRLQSGRVLVGCETGIYLTEDGADSWTRVLGTVDTVTDIQQSPHDSNFWLAVTQSAGAWISHDGGSTWMNLPDVPSGATLYNVTFDATNALRMAIGSWTYGVFTSEDGGLTWGSRNVGLPASHHVWRVGVDPDTGRLYASVIQSSLFVSDDFGRTWQKGGLDGVQISAFVFVPK
jgi:hypothetical protein